MRTIEFVQPRKVMFGAGCTASCADDLLKFGLRRVLIVTSEPIVALVDPMAMSLRTGGAAVEVYAKVNREPSIEVFEEAVSAARSFGPDAVVGFGGGSAMDTAKLVAALHDSDQTLLDVLGIDLLAGRRTYLACVPTTSGTGSEVTPYAIFHHEEEQLKKGVVSPFIVPEAAYVDPALTVTMPPPITASTGMDALTHCVEAYVNRYAHPMVDMYALAGIRLIAGNLERAVTHGDDAIVRAALSLGSLYGGMCLGPVNTGAVHALAYPLGGEFHVAHGVSNSVLLPHVAAFNLPAVPERYADVALAMGVEQGEDISDTARRGIERIRELSSEIGIPSGMSALGVPVDAIPRMAESAMKVTRLLKLNPREMTATDAEAIYRQAF